jgi:ATP-binding cassette subfamily F protein uup
MATTNTEVVLTATDLEYGIGSQDILTGVSLTVHAGDRIGLVGRNGAGKSTLLKLLIGQMSPTKGAVMPRRDLLTGFLPQAFELEDERTISENIAHGIAHLKALLDEFEQLPPMSDRAATVEAQITAADGWNLDTRVAQVMSALAVPAGHRQVATLSGGERRRVALCRALVAQPELLLLDEPTNHLDTPTIEWLEQYLRGYQSTCIFVTHDRFFLDRLATRIIDIDRGQSHSYQGNYTEYLETRATRHAVAQVEDQKRQLFLRRELDWIRRGPKARTTKQKSRIDRFEEASAKADYVADTDVDLVIPPAPQLGNRVVEVDNISIEIGGQELVRDFSLHFEKGMRLGIVGRNGAGKTTLLKVILGELKPARGLVTVGELTRFNYVDQARVQLNEEQTAMEAVGEGVDHVRLGDTSVTLRGYLKRFLFTDERLNTRVAQLSGGERSRLLMAKILKDGGNFLILDEPTNDLDLPTLRVLEEAIVAFGGCVVAVSHDRYFLNRICTGVLAFEEDATVTYTPGNYDDYIARQKALASEPAPTVQAEVATQKPQAKARRLSWKEQKELQTIESDILAAETETERLETLFATSEFHVKHGHETKELTAALDMARAEVSCLYERWTELEEGTAT